MRVLGSARSPSGIELSPRAEGILQWYGSKKCDGETTFPMERGKCMEKGVSGGVSGRRGCVRAEQLSEKLT